MLVATLENMKERCIECVQILFGKLCYKDHGNLSLFPGPSEAMRNKKCSLRFWKSSGILAHYVSVNRNLGNRNI